MTGVPATADSFIGREFDLAALAGLIDQTRMITVTGVGGSGKTRLAIELTHRLESRFDDAIHFVDLSPLVGPEDVYPAVAAAMGVTAAVADGSALALAWPLADRSALLILDNCEHLVSACAELCADLLARWPNLWIVATSREPLWVRGEHLWPLEPLATPAEDESVIEEVGASPAVRLFMARASACRPGLQLTEQNAAVVADVCRRLDGLPLALELSAARVGSLSLDDLASRIDGRMRLLSRGNRAGPQRQQTLQAAIDWSYSLLSEDEQQVFQRLGVFVGGATLAAIEAVCDHPAAAELVESLVVKSLVRFRETEGGGRYSLLESLRLYALERLETGGGADAARRCHAGYYRTYAAEWGNRFTDPGRYRRMLAELDNFRAAMNWLVAGGDSESGLVIVAALFDVWWLSGRVREGRHWTGLFAATDGRGRDQNLRLRARALHVAGTLAVVDRDFISARVPLEAAVALYAEIGSHLDQSLALNNLALVHRRLGDGMLMRRTLEEGLHLIEGPDASPQIATLYANLMLAGILTGDLAMADTRMEDALRVAERYQLASTIALTHAHAVLVSLAREDPKAAHAQVVDAIRLSRAADASWLLVPCLIARAHLERTEGATGAALATLREAFALFGVQGIDDWLTFGLESLVVMIAELLPQLAATVAGLRDAVCMPLTNDVRLDISREFEAAMAAVAAVLGRQRVTELRARGRATPPARTLRIALDEAQRVMSSPPASEPAATESDAGIAGSSGRAAGEPHYGGRLSPREAEVLNGLISGASNKEIAGSLGMSVRTVERHLQNMYLKLGARGRADAITWGLTNRASP
jgi:predicted ATPase/DNA-binding CsgD family transcriptional regulator